MIVGRQENTIITSITSGANPETHQVNLPDTTVKKIAPETTDLSDEKMEEFVLNIPTPTRPITHRLFSEFESMDEKITNKGAHEVTRMSDKNTNKTLFLKYTSDERIACLEAAAAGAYKMYAPHHVPDTFAVHKNGHYVGVASEAIPNFQSIAENKLEKVELNYDFLNTPSRVYLMSSPEKNNHVKKSDKNNLYLYKKADKIYYQTYDDGKEYEIDSEIVSPLLEEKSFDQPELNPEKCENKTLCNTVLQITEDRHHTEAKISIDTLEIADKKLRELESSVESEEAAIVKQLNELEKQKKEINLKISQFRNLDNFAIANGKPRINSDNETSRLKKLLRDNAAQGLELEEKRVDHGDIINKFYEKTCLENQITFEELERYRIIKGLAIALTTSYIFMEDDLHRNNFTKYGHRIDFDMSFWPLFDDFKDKDLVTKLFHLRAPGEHITKVSAYDIIHLPNTRDFKPYFWPTRPPRNASLSSTTTAIKSTLKYPNNDYHTLDNQVFQQLEDNPIFKYHKYAVMTKCILTTSHVCRQNALRHIPIEFEYAYNDKKDYLINHFVKQHESRISDFRNELIKIPEFREFFRKNHEKIAAEFVNDLAAQGMIYSNNSNIENDLNPSINGEHNANADIKQQCDALLQLITTEEKKDEEKQFEISLKPPTPEEKYNELDKLIRNSMNIYINPTNDSYFTGFTSFFGWMRNHAALATKITKDCEQLNEKNKSATTLNSDKHVKAIQELSNMINAELQPFETAQKEKIAAGIKEDPGEMHKTLLTLKQVLDNTLASETMMNAASQNYNRQGISA